jgi:hypothetical protein
MTARKVEMQITPRSRCLWFKKICYRKGIFWQSNRKEKQSVFYNEAKSVWFRTK